MDLQNVDDKDLIGFTFYIKKILDNWISNYKITQNEIG